MFAWVRRLDHYFPVRYWIWALSVVGRLYDPLALWRAQCSATVTGQALDASHFLAEELPDETAALLSGHLLR